MKKLISILVIVAMLLASVLAVIPASAAKTSDTALATYSVNWEALIDAGTMESQWYGDIRNDYDTYFTVTATETQIASEPKVVGNKTGDTRAYYSTDMFDITETTYYEYVFEAKNNDKNHGGYAGVIFAFNYKPDTDDYMPYFMYGAFQNDSDDGEFADFRLQFGHHDGADKWIDAREYPAVKPIDADGNHHFGRYKVVFDGFDVNFYYYDANDQFVEMFDDVTCTLPSDAKVCVGVYSRDGDRNVVLKNAVLTAHNYETAAIINGTTETKGDLAKAIDVALANIASDKYVATTETALQNAVDAAVIAYNNADATAIADAKTAIDNVTLTLKATAADKAALKLPLDKANALSTKDDSVSQGDWDDFVAARNTAQTLYDNAEASQADVVAATTALADAYALVVVVNTLELETAITAANAKVEADYTKATWDAFAAKLAAAEDCLVSIDQAAIDTATTELEDAMTALVPAAANLGALKTACDAAALITEKPANVTDPAWNAFTADRDAANDLLTARSDDEDAVASATAALNGAMNLFVGKINVMGNSNANTQFAGNGNVFYYDYHKYAADKWDGVSAFPNVSSTGNAGNGTYMLRLGNNGGSGTASVCDGTKDDGNFSHELGDITINDITYKHAFGYSFKERVTVDSVAFYLPTTTEITTIDVYGAVLSEKEGATVYGKDADKVLLGRFTVGAAADGAANIEVKGALDEAYSVDYIFFAVHGPTSSYKFYEIELYGILNGADFSALKEVIAAAGEKAEIDYTEETWTTLTNALTAANTANKNALSTQAELNAAKATLTDAINNLALKPLDKAALQASIATAEALKQADYVSTSWATLAAPLAAAKTANESTEIKQSDVNAAKAALDAAVAALVKRGDKTELNALIASCKELKEAEWQGNETAWGMFVKGIEAAEALVADADASEADVAGMVTALTEKKAALVATETTGGEGEGEGEGETETDAPVDDAETEAPAGDETEAPADDETEAPKKGGCGSSIALSALAVIGVVGTALVIKKKED